MPLDTEGYIIPDFSDYLKRKEKNDIKKRLLSKGTLVEFEFENKKLRGWFYEFGFLDQCFIKTSKKGSSGHWVPLERIELI